MNYLYTAYKLVTANSKGHQWLVIINGIFVLHWQLSHRIIWASQTSVCLH